ncbi:MAG: sensor histidine kinase [Ferruginibacter sp.]|nr:sensor histidine kinase [Ferruginibacter sp.]
MNDELYYTVVVGTSILFVLGGFIISFFLAYVRRKTKFLKEKQLMHNQFQQELLKSQIEIQEQTFQHISRELHDNLGQVASLIKINLNTLQLPAEHAATVKIENTKELTRQLIADIKSLSVSLASDRIAQTGFEKAIETDVDRLNKTGEFIASFRQYGSLPEISDAKQLILYRMSQEILNNMIKHSSAKQIEISLHATEKLIKLAFNDDGIGFNVEEQMNTPGAGLRNLQSRALLINAQLQIQSSPGNGTQITIELPL